MEVLHRIEQQSGLHARSTAEFHQRAARTRKDGYLARLPTQDRGLGSGGIVFGLLADHIEQRRASRIVEILGRDRPRRASQTAKNVTTEGVAIGQLAVVGRQKRHVHRRSSERRIPPNIQRASGGKKLR